MAKQQPQRIFIKPCMVTPAGRAPTLATIPYPNGSPKVGKVLPPDGDTVAQDSYWLRMIRDGSVEIVEPPKQAPAQGKKGSAE